MRRVALLLAACTLAGCVWMQTVWREGRDVGVPAAAAVGAYLITAPVGGAVAVFSIFGATAATGSLMRSASYAAGETQGEGATDKEFARLKERVPQLEKNLQAAQGAASWFSVWYGRLKIGLVLFFLAVNWKHIWNFLIWLRRGYLQTALWTLIHMFVRVKEPPKA